jgi:hypothetical protein
MHRPLTSGAYLHLYVDGEVYLPGGRKGIGIFQGFATPCHAGEWLH